VAPYWASVCGFHPSNLSIWLRSRGNLSEGTLARLLSVLSLDSESLTEATEAFFESPAQMALVSPEPDVPASLTQAPKIALLSAKNIRIILLRKLFPTKKSTHLFSQKAGKLSKKLCRSHSVSESPLPYWITLNTTANLFTMGLLYTTFQWSEGTNIWGVVHGAN
jgi:hypothetical protein